jgi:deazaflavin-dependent oxidoreductase (nitroreductase family)
MHLRDAITSAWRRSRRRRAAFAHGRPTGRVPRPILELPALIFRVGLDVLVPHLVLLETRGRKSGRRRAVVLNVTTHQGSDLIVLSVDGRRAGWVQNLMAEPKVVARHRGRSFDARATVDESIDPGELAVALYRRRPVFVRLAYRLVGERIDGEPAVRRLAADRVPVRIAPVPDTAS